MRIMCIFFLFGMVGIVQGELPPPERSYKILMLLPASAKSHRNAFLPLAEALADRGHQIVMLTNSKTALEYPNVEEINHGLPYFNFDEWNMFKTRGNINLMFQMFAEALPRIAREIFSVPHVKNLYEKRREFDLIIVNNILNEVIYPFLHEMPHITIAPFGLDPRQSATLGNPLHPAYMQNLMFKVDLSSVYGRFLNLIFHVIVGFHWRHWAIVPLIQKEITAQFPELPPLLTLEGNASLTLMNTHFSMEMALPLLPSQVEIGGMHCRPGKALPEDLKTWIEEAGPSGAIYFSLGSIAKGESMPIEYRNIFIEVFKKLRQRVVWKFEGELRDIPMNVMIRKWLPQQDILAHPNVKVFISHGGGLSTLEASYHGVPMLALPIFGDQPRNARVIEETERGLSLEWEELTEEQILSALTDIINNRKYRDNMVSASKSLRDQMESPKDRAVFWTEYVIRHRGAPQLRSPGAELSWVEFLLLDVLALLIATFSVAFVVFYWIIKKIINIAFSKKEKKKIL